MDYTVLVNKRTVKSVESVPIIILNICMFGYCLKIMQKLSQNVDRLIIGSQHHLR